MSARYWVLIADEVAGSKEGIRLPDGIRLTGRMPVPPLPPYAEGRPAAARWYLIEDDHAGPELEGRQVELVLGRRGRNPAKTVIIERRPLA